MPKKKFRVTFDIKGEWIVYTGREWSNIPLRIGTLKAAVKDHAETSDSTVSNITVKEIK